MPESYKTILAQSSGEFIERKSRFIGYCMPVEEDKNAVDFINSIRSKHWDATHNVYAYLLLKDNIMRYSDDGEPQNTAGLPILNLIQKIGITNIVIVVSRYFGGTLLGTGGLIRAYSHAAKIAIDSGKIVIMENCKLVKLTCKYSLYGKVEAALRSFGCTIDNCEFSDNVKVLFHVSSAQFKTLETKIIDLTSSDVLISLIGEKSLPVHK